VFFHSFKKELANMSYMHRKVMTCLLLTLALCLSLLPQPLKADAASPAFSDVPRSKPYSSAVYQLAEQGIIGGYSDGTFKPGNSITRGQAAAIVAKLLNLDTRNVKNPGFKDVSPAVWSYGAIAAAAEKGIFSGYGDGRFGPYDIITRAQMASVLIKTFNMDTPIYMTINIPFEDVYNIDIGHRFAISTLYKLGIVSGTSRTSFSPNNPISRAQAAVLITGAEKAVSRAAVLEAEEMGWSSFTSVNDYHGNVRDGEAEKEIIFAMTDSSKVLVFPMKEGTQKLSVLGKKKDGDKAFQKYYVHVKKENGQLKASLEETDDISPTEERLTVKRGDIKQISLSTIDGRMIEDQMKYQIIDESKEHLLISMLIAEPGEYIAAIEYEDGSKARFAMRAEAEPGEFYMQIYSIEERPQVTVDLSKKKGDFSEFKYGLPNRKKWQE
jgi:hypothetical protein